MVALEDQRAEQRAAPMCMATSPQSVPGRLALHRTACHSKSAWGPVNTYSAQLSSWKLAGRKPVTAAQLIALSSCRLPCLWLLQRES